MLNAARAMRVIYCFAIIEVSKGLDLALHYPIRDVYRNVFDLSIWCGSIPDLSLLTDSDLDPTSQPFKC